METLTIRNPRIVALALLVILAAGISALFSLGRQEDPTITNINATITTPYPGADPARVESLVTRPLEEAMRAEGGRDADLTKVAERLGVTVQMLEEALPGPGR